MAALSALMLQARDDNEDIPQSNERATVLGVVITFEIIAFFAVVLRIYSRAYVVRSPGLDDLFVIFAMIMSFIGAVCVCLSTNYGLGHHFYDLPSAEAKEYLKLFYIANATYCFSTTLIKMSLLFQYLRIYTKGMLRWACLILLVIVTTWGIAFTILAFFPCQPVNAYWDRSIPNHKCWGYGSVDPGPFVAIYSAQAAINMWLDLCIYLIPITLFFRSDLTKNAKRGLSGLLLVATLVLIISVLRLVSICQTHGGTWPIFDPTFEGPRPILLSCLEIELSVLCASVPVFWPIIAKLTGGKILVVQEIQIEREAIDDDHHEMTGARRRASNSDDSVTRGGSDDDDDKTLSRTGSHESDKKEARTSVLEGDRKLTTPTMFENVYGGLGSRHDVRIEGGHVPFSHIDAAVRDR